MLWLYIVLGLIAVVFLIAWGFKARLDGRKQFYVKQGIPLEPAENKKYTSHPDGGWELKMYSEEHPNETIQVANGPGVAWLRLYSPELIKEFAMIDNKYYKKPFKVPGTGVLTSEGELWKKHRKALSNAMQYGFQNSMIPASVASLDYFLNFLSNDEKYKTQTFNFPEVTQVLISDAMARVFFGIKPVDYIINGKPACAEANEIQQLRTKYMQNPLVFVIGPKFLNLFGGYRSYIRRNTALKALFRKVIKAKIEEIQQAKADGKEVDDATANSDTLRSKDLLHLLIEDRIKFNDDPAKTLSDDEIMDEFFTFFFGAKDNTGSFLSSITNLFYEQKEYADKVRAEVREKIKDFRKLSMDDINALDTVTTFCKETLRVYSPAPGTLPRLAKEDHQLGKYNVRKGDWLTVVASNQWNPKYHENPRTFDPSRWDKGKEHEAYSFLPFSTGPRVCPGQHMATLMGKIYLIILAKFYEIEPVDKDYVFKIKLGNTGYMPCDTQFRFKRI